MRRLLILFVLISSVLVGAVLIWGDSVSAQVAVGLEEVGGVVNLPATDPRIIATRIINISLGFLGMILLILVLYAGFLWMTSGGEADKVSKAKKILVSAVIGAVIVLSSWAIARYVLERLIEAAGPPSGISPVTPPGLGFGGGGAAQAFQLKSISPQGSVSIRNVQVKFLFTRLVDEKTASAIQVAKTGGQTVAGVLTVNGSLVTFAPAESCPPPNETLKCFEADSDFTVKVGDALRSTQNQSIVCGGFAPSCTAAFHTGNLIDVQAPNVFMSEPLNGQAVPADSLVLLRAQSSDDSGVANVNFYDGGEMADQTAPNEIPTPKNYTAEGYWDTAGIELQSIRQLSAKAFDINDHEKQSAAIGVIVRPASCFNRVQDGEETDVDCGGTPNTPSYCGACSGGACVSNFDCSSGVCQNGLCVDQPIISNVSPLDGRAGTFVTLKGVNFGNTGTVVFLGGANGDDDKTASVPQICLQGGFNTWSRTQVIVAVPEGAAGGPLQLVNGDSQLGDRTNDAVGPVFPDFLVNDNVYPGLCGLNPSKGFVGEKFTAAGQGFGQNPSSMLFGKNVITQFASWSNEQVAANVPVVNAGKNTVTVVAGKTASNPAEFEVLSKAKAGPPQIFSVDPSSGPKGEYLTLSGKNFGYNVGTVRFKNKFNQLEALGDVSFPAACSQGYWTETSVIVKVPPAFLNQQGILAGDYSVRLKRADNAESNEINFAVNEQSPKPGICSINPSVGPVGTTVSLIGERFGTDTGNVTFNNNKAAIVDSWKNQEVKTKVPAGAETGPAVITAQAVKSNPAYFQVRNCHEQPDICSPDEQCCGDGTCLAGDQICPAISLKAMFAWQSSTGFIPVAPRVVEECAPNQNPAPVPSPSPWDNRSGGDAVCVNAAINARFTTHLDPSSATAANFKLKKCISQEKDPCSKVSEVVLDGGFPLLQPASQDQDLVVLQAKNNLEISATYLVEILTGVKGKGVTGANMDESAKCGSGVAYCFRFTTRNSQEPCKVGGVSVSPHPYELNDSGLELDYLASPLAADDKCVVLQCKQYDWMWEHGDNNGDNRAIFKTPLKEEPNTGKVSCRQVGISVSETGDVPVGMNATALPDKVKGTAQLFIRFVPPRVEAFAPDCQTACLNALIWAKFNTEIDPASIVDNVEVRACANENCVISELEQLLAIPPDAVKLTTVPKTAEQKKRFLSIEPVDNFNQPFLLPGKYYRVLLRGGNEQGIRGLHGVPMTGLNDPEGFVWTFRTKLGQEGFCAAEAVDVAPLEKYETEVDARQLFQATAFGAPDECSVIGQALVQTENAKWATFSKLVADFFDNGQIDTGAALPPRCSSMCLAMGAQAEFGKVAVCGNGIIETTDAVYCKNGATLYGDKCAVLPPGARAGEQCDPGILSNAGLCDPHTCLWKPIGQAPGGTCGNGKIDQGEACDFGSVCLGADAESDTPDGTVCTEPAVKAKCAANKGVCAPRQFRGCSPFCRHTGAKSGNATCGNGDIADGEDCDDGNTTSRDGCSSDCLHEGSSPSIASVCGNGILEPGETCEKLSVNDPFPPGCGAKTCLHLGTALCDNDSNTPDVNCCGNAKPEPGEDCDDGNKTMGDGCSMSCLLEGSSNTYFNPSFCGDGVLEKGEQCEAGLPSSHKDLKNAPNNAVPAPPKGSLAGDGLVDSAQLAFIAGDADPDEKGLMSSKISVELLAKTGEAVYGLQCGFTSEDSCKPGYGLTDPGCCNVRPELESADPSGDKVCRNAQISARFKTDMDADSVLANARIAKAVGEPQCPPGTVLVADDFTPVPQGIKSWLASLWQEFVAWWTGQPTLAQIWCAGSVTGSWAPLSVKDHRKFVFRLDAALEAKTKYRVKFSGDPNLADNSDPAKKLGIKTVKGVVAPFDSSQDSGPLTFSFETGEQICGLNLIEVTDDAPEHPLLFVKKDETHPFYAAAKSLQNGKAVIIVPVDGYQWEWQPWSTSKKDVVAVVKPEPQNKTQANIKAENKNGTAFVTAMIKIVSDTFNQPSTLGASLHGTASVTVTLCENPWPNLDTPPLAPFRDKKPTGQGLDSSLPGTIFENGPYYNFSTTYCRDFGAFGTGDDLPGLDIAYVPQTPVSKAEGILREYLFTYGKNYPELKKDGIGIRIVSNPLHYSPEDWYKWRGFGGSPKSIEVDGYDALEDGTTVYVAAANTEGPNQDIYSNIYLISHNPDAATTTVEIFNQLVENLTFNINLSQGVANVCEEKNDPNTEPQNPYLNEKVEEPLACSTDFDCLNKLGDDQTHCGSYKLKLARDTVRAADFQKMSRALEAAKARDGFYPKLTAGTFVPTFSNSRWPSWSKEFTAAVGAGVEPVDPVNQFLTCGRCQDSQIICGRNEDCPAGKTCQGYSVDKGVQVPAASVEPGTCYDTDARKFLCPKLGASPSRFYQYRSINNGQRYELMAEFEVPQPADPNAKWWNPPLIKEVRRCVNPQTLGYLCETDKDCRACPNPKDPVSCPENKYPVIPGACQVVGGKFVYQAICQNQFFGPSGTCGDDIIGQACAGGANNGNACLKNEDCPGGSCTASEACELKQTKLTDCTAPDNVPGLKLQVCSDCKEWVDDPNLSKCDAGIQCGNGRVDKQCLGGVRNLLACFSDSDCKGDPNKNTPDGICGPTKEKCDDGKLNGTYGHCNLTCDNYAAYCGDKLISPGETCDDGDQNGAYCGVNCDIAKSCGLDCKSKAPYCGDNAVTAPEECDGQTETTPLAICTAGTGINKPCTTKEDCGENGVCAVSPDPLERCKEKTINRCVTALKQCVTKGYKADVDPNTPAPVHDPSKYKVCQTDQDCAGEKDGKTYCRAVQDFVTTCANASQCSLPPGITGSCVLFPTAHVRTCKLDACKFAAWSKCEVVGFCGDGMIQKPGEECDNGKDNGDTKACTSECKKNICGDGKPLINVEECDNGKDNGKVTCNADYNATCNSCSLQCKFTASSGGFCGDQIKNGPEQCDGMDAVVTKDQYPDCQDKYKDSLAFLCDYLNADCLKSPCKGKTKEKGVTCQSLGYDFSINGAEPKLVPLNDEMKVYVKSSCELLGTRPKYELAMLNECAGVSCCENEDGCPPCVTMQGPCPFKPTLSLPQKQKSLDEFWKCVQDKGPALGVGVSGKPVVQCNKSCVFNGCGRCSDETGQGEISGQLVDAVYNQVVPSARVSLFYKGVLVKQIASDGDGKFILSGLNGRPECSQYKLVIDKYEDNFCTGNAPDRPSCDQNNYPAWTQTAEIDEGKRGGYWPLTTPFFTVSNFNEKVSQQKDGRIFIFPRPGAGEAYYSVFWGVDWSSQGYINGVNNNHLILPTGYTLPNKKDTTVCGGVPGDKYFGQPCDQDSDCQVNGVCGQGKCGAYQNQQPDFNVGVKEKSCTKDKDCKSTNKCNIPNPNFPASFTPTTCDYDKRPPQGTQCARDVTWSIPGLADLDKLPHAQLICLHNAGEKVGGFGPGSVMTVHNGCPVEGRDACLGKYPENYAKCGNGSQWPACSKEPYSSCGSSLECSAKGEGQCTGCPETWWDTCLFYKQGPTTTYFRYAPYANQLKPIRMMWGWWNKSVHHVLNDPPFDAPSAEKWMFNFLQEKKFSAVIATDKQIVEISEENLKDCDDSDDCKFWHIADLDPANGALTLYNQLREGRSKENYTDGIALYERSFGGWHEKDNYCIFGDKPNRKLFYWCTSKPWGDASCKAKNLGSCKPPSHEEWSRANY